MFVSMAENGVDKIMKGETTLDELRRVTDITVFFNIEEVLAEK